VPVILRRPEQGWSSLILLLGMLLVVGLSVADARPLVIEGQDRTGSLVVVMLASGLIGSVLARSSIGVVRAHLVGAAIGASMLLLIAAAAVTDSGQVLSTDWETLRQRLQELGLRIEAEMGPFMDEVDSIPTATTFLVLGAICWTTGQFSAFSIFRYERGGPAVMATGALLFLNVALQSLEPTADLLPVLPVLAIFSALSMLLLMRLQLTQAGRQWARRHIADTGEVSRLFLRTGTLFVALVIIVATSLTTMAMVPKQEFDIGDLEDPLEDLGEELSRWLTLVAVNPERQSRTTFGDELEVEYEWEKGEGTAFTALVDGGLRGNYWWGAAFRDFDGFRWRRDDGDERRALAGEPIAIEADASAAGPYEASALVTPADSSLVRGTVFAPSEPSVVDRDVRVLSLGGDEGLSDITFESDVGVGASYSVRSQVHDYAAEEGSFTANELRAAGTPYPGWIGRYVDVSDGASGVRTRELAAEIEELTASPELDNPYDKARLIQERLRDLDYRTVITCADGEIIPECLLRTGSGFCQQFATTMVMTLRELEIPARFVSGYLPGTLLEDGSYEVPMQALHTWVEVYFPDVGWVRFDPTPGTQISQWRQEPTAFEDGAPLASPGAEITPLPSLPQESLEPVGSPSPTLTAADLTGTGGGGADPVTTLIVAGGFVALTLAAVFGLLFVRLRRLSEPDGGIAYRGIVSLAARLGHGPHPSQTEYEYAASLSETLPSVRDDLYTVAEARVETTYGRRKLVAERSAALRRAYARIRTALLRLSLRVRR